MRPPSHKNTWDWEAPRGGLSAFTPLLAQSGLHSARPDDRTGRIVVIEKFGCVAESVGKGPWKKPLRGKVQRQDFPTSLGNPSMFVDYGIFYSGRGNCPGDF